MQAVYQKGNYSLLDDGGKETGRLINEGVFSRKVYIQTQDGQLDFVKNGLFSPMKINRGGRDIGEVKPSWKGMFFKLDVDSRIREYQVCQKSIWKSTFILTNELKEELLTIEPLFKWRKMNYDYEIKISERQEQRSNPTLILLALYGVRSLMEHQYAAS